MNEQWRDVPGYEGRYQASTLGDVRSQKCLLRTMRQRSGYRRVFLYHSSLKKVEWFVHRLVATTFLPNPDGLPFVDHKNGDKVDNRVENLEWVSVQENTMRYYALSRAERERVAIIDIPIDPADIPF